MPRPLIEIQDLTYVVGGRVILDHITLTVYEKDIFAVLGLSGTGKTTLLRLMIGLIAPTSGTLSILGQDIARISDDELNKLREKMGLVFQYGALFDSLNVRENVGFRLYEQTNLPEEEIGKVVDERLRQVGLSGIEDLMPIELSGGMQKRVGIARSLVSNPSLMLYDEPTSGLDPVISAAIDELIVSLRNMLGVTEVVVSHDVRSIFRMADRVAMLYEGRVQLVGTPDEFRDTQDPVVRQFLEGSTNGPIQVI